MGSCSPSKDGPRHLMLHTHTHAHTHTHTHRHLSTVLPCPPADRARPTALFPLPLLRGQCLAVGWPEMGGGIKH